MEYMHYDLIIIGMGLSGLMAAKTAVERGKKVLILGKGIGSLSLYSNTIDVLDHSLKTMKMRDSLPQWIKDHPEHPYSKIGQERIEEALSSFLSLFPSSYSFQAIDNSNSLIPTAAGTLRPTYLIPTTMADGISLNPERMLIVGIEGFKDFYAHYVADQLKCRGITLSLPDVLHQEITATALSRLMEKQSFRESIGREIRKELHGEIRVGLPALLGINDPIQVKEELEKIIEANVFEIPTLPPSIPGMRIFKHFKKWLIQKGCTFLLGYSVSKVTLKGKKCEGIGMYHTPLTNFHSADRYILATGRFIGGGLIADKDKISEPIFNLPIYQPESREDWFRNNFFEIPSHTIHQTGILVDSSFRPVDERGYPILENVWAAGTILGHHDCIDEKSREGIEISTGYMATQNALEA
jgi:glycerol-3-phosphate dehydrogenase subunit B